MSLKGILVTIAIVEIVSANNITNNFAALSSNNTGCHRHRKPWHELEDSERELYISGFLQLSSNGKLTNFTNQHASDISGVQAHTTAAFLPWHRYFLWEIENAFRSLGPEYECFAIPYWDWSYETTQTSFIKDFVIMNSGLGKFGDSENEFCLNKDDDNFGQGNYKPVYCINKCKFGECSLQRGNCQSSVNNTCIFLTPQETINIILKWDNYGTDEFSSTFNGFRYNLEDGSHGQAHNYIGSGGHLSNLKYSPDDPIFYLLHSFVDYQWALWQDCHDYDLINNSQITQQIYGGTLTGTGGFLKRRRRRGPSRIDDILIYDILKEIEWTNLYQTQRNYTPRDMHNISDWGVSYQQGTFWISANIQEVCPKINENWFYDDENEGERRRMVRRRLMSQERNQRSKVRELCVNSAAGQYAKNTYNLLKAKYGKNDERRSNYDDYKMMIKGIINEWSMMTCEYNNNNNTCNKAPQYFDDCGDYEIIDEIGDIIIEFDELLNKKGLTECMISTRRQFYGWAKQNNNLLGLCRGDYDINCLY